MITSLRWEVCALFEPWAAPQASLLGPPLASGSVTRDDGNASPPADSFFAASDLIEVPAAIDGARSYTLALETFGPRGWIVTFGTPEMPPQPGDSLDHLTDPHPCVVVPPSGLNGSGRSREIRAVRPGSVFIVRPSR